ncbi:CAP domain-containing protein [Cohnella fermenti]|uniref:SCP-like extracellular n=1 Tax=Cohnella fermenti TaxID=2565925 RepID=A0A4S4CA62_9BACL|nr:CAP domain-containing protein [Cohnella fermenti]THF84657.1 SCP-like extracellular [Cohnella fermenti]
MRKKRSIGLAAVFFLLLSGCTSNPHWTAEQLTDNQGRLGPVSRQGMPAALPHAASSVSTADSSYQALRAQEQIEAGHSSWLDRFIRDHVPYRPDGVSSPSDRPRTYAAEAAKEPKEQVLALVNLERERAGLAPLRAERRLGEMASVKAEEMDSRNYFSHRSPTFGSPFEMMTAFGIRYRVAGETIAQGQDRPAEVVEQWMASPQHRANLLSAEFAETGIGYYNGKWVQEFAGD